VTSTEITGSTSATQVHLDLVHPDRADRFVHRDVVPVDRTPVCASIASTTSLGVTLPNSRPSSPGVRRDP
jgi:hypothetical protein